MGRSYTLTIIKRYGINANMARQIKGSIKKIAKACGICKGLHTIKVPFKSLQMVVMGIKQKWLVDIPRENLTTNTNYSILIKGLNVKNLGLKEE